MGWVATYYGPTASTPAARQLRMLGIEPRVQVVTESFLTIPALVAGTRRIALLQERLVMRLSADAGIRALPCPFEAGPLVDAMWWHPIYDRDPEHTFFRDLVRRAAATVTGDVPAG
jgi:DNA-binding transcriptional LysR family regulator